MITLAVEAESELEKAMVEAGEPGTGLLQWLQRNACDWDQSFQSGWASDVFWS